MGARGDAILEHHLTPLEADVLEHGFGENEYDETGGAVWDFSIAPACKVAEAVQVPGVVSSLVKKGLAWTQDNGSEGNVTGLTERGKAALRALKGGL